MLPTLLILATLAAGDEPTALRAELAALHDPAAWRVRDRATRDLAAVDWRCHPEAAAALADALRRDEDARVRAGAARALGRMVVDLSDSHLALADAARLDAAKSVRKEATRALAAKGRRCRDDCPICGPLPRNSVIVGPTFRLPDWAGPPAPAPAPASGLPDPLPPQR